MADFNGSVPSDGRLGPATSFRLYFISILAALIGVGAGVIAYILYNLIGLFTNLSFFQRFSFSFASPWQSNLGPLIILIPVLGGIIVGIMAKYGSEQI